MTVMLAETLNGASLASNGKGNFIEGWKYAESWKSPAIAGNPGGVPQGLFKRRQVPTGNAPRLEPGDLGAQRLSLASDRRRDLVRRGGFGISTDDSVGLQHSSATTWHGKCLEG
mmetsp:Transcript_142844/g.456501  ORF Transcript_142844/g.456501 Transcript_142844/m.456501 type:complete len:114 (+) Transcript_142844:406-747(+)